ncbi:MAG: NAD-dependent epimerase/dehydratase family protein [Candidatus Pacebacteria bacterium]|nr:NAD-dependent epimerase/dehydratase family protein [Candidatus Paceibacterota bacterium]
MEKVIVTGGAGFIGSHIVDALVDMGYDVHVIDNLSFGKKENVNPAATLHVVDIREYEKLLPVFKDVKYVFHQAARPQVQYSIENPIETNENNVTGLLNVLEASRLNNVKRFIFASSAAVYGDQENFPLKEEYSVSQLSPYAVHKYIGEIYLKLYSEIYNLETVSLRYFNVYGSRQSINGSYPLVIPLFLNIVSQGKPMPVTGDGENTRDYVNVKDVARANVRAMLSESVGKGEVVNISFGKQYSVNEIAKLIGGPVEYVPARIEPRASLADITKAKKLLDWEPIVSLEDGLNELKSLI